MKLSYYRSGIPLWYIEDLPNIPFSGLRDVYKSIYDEDLNFEDIKLFASESIFPEPIFGIGDLAERVKSMNPYKFRGYMNIFKKIGEIKRGPSRTMIRLNLLSAIYFLNKYAFLPENCEKLLCTIGELFPEDSLSKQIASYLRRSRAKDFVETLKTYKNIIDGVPLAIKKFKRTLKDLRLLENCEKYVMGDEKFTEKPLVLDKISIVLQLLQKGTELIPLKESELSEEFLYSLKEVEPYSYLMYLIKNHDGYAAGQNIWLSCNVDISPPIVFMSSNGRCRFALWESSLENVYHFTNLSDIEIPEEAVIDNEEGKELLHGIAELGLILECKEHPNIVGFNSARGIILPMRMLESELDSAIIITEYEDEDQVNLLELENELYNNFIDSFKSAAWFPNLLRCGLRDVAIRRLKKIRSSEPALHEGNLFNKYSVFDNIGQKISRKGSTLIAKSHEFYTDFCGTNDALSICEYSILSNPYIFLQNKENMKSKGMSYIFIRFFNESRELVGFKIKERLYSNFEIVSERDLHIDDIIDLTHELNENTMAAVLAKRII